jgi:predicted transposase/invertase (TIGR01784 family)
VKRDTLFHQIFRQFPQTIFELLSEVPSDATNYTFDSIEVKETSFRTDGVSMPPTAQGTAIFTEVQMQPDQLFYERLLAESNIFAYRHADSFQNWRAIVIYPNVATEQASPLRDDIQLLIDNGHIQRIYLDEFNGQTNLPIGIALMVLTILEDQEAIDFARETIAQPQQEQAIIDIVSSIMVYKFTNLSRAEVETMLATSIQQTRVYQEAFEEGEAKGKAEGKAEMILLALEDRFGTMSPDVVERVSELSLEYLTELGRDLWNFSEPDDLQAWLDRTASLKENRASLGE